MLKEDVLKKLTDCGLVAVVRANNAEEAIKISDACLAGGCTGIELTFTVPGADKVIAALAEKYSNGEMMLGAGTVLDPETARMAILAGANFIVSPAFKCRKQSKLCKPVTEYLICLVVLQLQKLSQLWRQVLTSLRYSLQIYTVLRL